MVTFKSCSPSILSNVYNFPGLSEDPTSESIPFSSSAQHEVVDDMIKIQFTIPASIAAGASSLSPSQPKVLARACHISQQMPLRMQAFQPCSSEGNSEDLGTPDTPDDPFIVVPRGYSTTPAPAHTSQLQTPKALFTWLIQLQSPTVPFRQQGTVVNVGNSVWPVYPLPGHTTIPLQSHLNTNHSHGWYIINKGLKLSVFWNYW